MAIVVHFTISGFCLTGTTLNLTGTSTGSTVAVSNSYSFTVLAGTYTVTPVGGFAPPSITVTVGPDAPDVNFASEGQQVGAFVTGI
jgi:hypothetical protein